MTNNASSIHPPSWNRHAPLASTPVPIQQRLLFIEEHGQYKIRRLLGCLEVTRLIQQTSGHGQRCHHVAVPYRDHLVIHGHRRALVTCRTQQPLTLGIRAFILSGYPHLEECDLFAKHVLPRLDTVKLNELQGRLPKETPGTPLTFAVRK